MQQNRDFHFQPVGFRAHLAPENQRRFGRHVPGTFRSAGHIIRKQHFFFIIFRQLDLLLIVAGERYAFGFRLNRDLAGGGRAIVRQNPGLDRIAEAQERRQRRGQHQRLVDRNPLFPGPEQRLFRVRGRHDAERGQVIRQFEFHRCPALRVRMDLRVMIRRRLEFLAQLDQFHHRGHVHAAAAAPFPFFTVIPLPDDAVPQFRRQHGQRPRPVEIIERIRRLIADQIQHAHVHHRHDHFRFLPLAFLINDLKLDFDLGSRPVLFLRGGQIDFHAPLGRIDFHAGIAHFEARLSQIEVAFDFLVGQPPLNQNHADIDVGDILRLDRNLNRRRAPFDGFDPAIHHAFALHRDQRFHLFVRRFDQDFRGVARLILLFFPHQFDIIIVRAHPGRIAFADGVKIIGRLNDVAPPIRPLRLDFVIADFLDFDGQFDRLVRALHRQSLDDFFFFFGFPG